MTHKVELRYAGKRLDEVVAEHATVHLEQMADQHYSLIIETKDECAILSIGSVSDRAHVAAQLMELSVVHRRRDAAIRRENRKKLALGVCPRRAP